MSLLERNLAALYSSHPALRDLGLEEAEGPGLRLEITASGSPTALLEGSYLHSRYDPREEARRLLGRELSGTPSAVLFLGFGLGYLPEAFLGLHPDRVMAVVEPEPHLFRQALEARDLAALLSSPRVSWHIGQEPERVIMDLEELPLANLQLLRLRPLYLRRAAYYRKLELLLQSLLDRREVNLNTLRRFGRLWVRNLLSNLELFLRSPGAAGLEGVLSGLPALLLAAGPSLEAVLPRLPELSLRLVLVAVDTSYALCRQAGAEPDFLVTVDPQYWNSRHLDRASLGRTVLVSEPSANPRTFRLLQGGSPHFVSSFFPIGQLLEDLTGIKGRVGAGGSVATTAWDLARLMGAEPLYAAGLDLGYPGRRTHCRGAYFEELRHCLSSRLAPAELSGHLALTAAGAFPLASNSGGWTLTDRRLIIYKWWFENQLKQHRTRCYSLCPEGVAIEGLETRDLESLLGLPVVRAEIERRLEAARRRGGEAPPPGLGERAREALGRLAAELAELAGLARQGLELCARLRRSGPGGGEAARLEELDRRILQASSRQVAGFLFQPLIQKIVGSAGEVTDYAGALELSAQLYRELASSADYQASLLRRRLERI